MAVEFKILKFQVEPFTLKQIMQFNSNREYFLIANSVLSLNELYVLFYPFEQANMQSVPDGAFAIYQGGYYEPTKVPANAISVYNLSGVNTINGFILYIQMPASFLSNFTIETGSANALHAPATGSAFAAVSPSAKLIRVKPYISFYASDYNSAGTLYSLFTHRQINSVIVDITFSYHCTCLTDAMTIPSIFATLIAGATNIVQDNVVGTPTVLLDVSKSYIFTNLRIPLPLLTLPILVPDSRSLSNITGSCTAAYTFTYKIKKIIPNSTFIV